MWLTIFMQSSLFDKYKVQVTSKKQERGELLLQLMEPINVSRACNGYVKVSIARMGQLVSHIKTEDLYYLLSICKDAGNRNKNYHVGFSKMFYWSIKPKQNEN